MQALTSTTRATLRAPRRATTRMEAETSAAPKAPAAKKQRKPAPLEVGGTKSGAQAAGKAASAKAVAAATGSTYVEPASATTFNDPRWVEGCWDFAQFKGADGETDWNSVVDAEVRRVSCLPHTPLRPVLSFPRGARWGWMFLYPARGTPATPQPPILGAYGLGVMVHVFVMAQCARTLPRRLAPHAIYNQPGRSLAAAPLSGRGTRAPSHGIVRGC